MLATIAIILAVGQNAPGQVGYDIEDLHPIPPLPQTMRSPMPSLPPAAAAPQGGDGRAPAPRFGVHRSDDGSYTADHGTFVARVDRGGRVSFRDRSGYSGRGTFGLVGAVGLLGTWGGQEPNYHHKRSFLDSTFDERLSMRVEDDALAMDAALRALPAYLAAVWRYDPWSVPMRKRILFELWDECAELGSATLRAGGTEARAIIGRFIRRYLPRDSAYAYTVAELRALNSERSSAHAFDPYGTVLLSAGGGTEDDANHDVDAGNVGAARSVR